MSELLQNSLDAQATQIDIGVDCEEWSCWVKDNGHGINKDGLDTLSNDSDDGRYGALSMSPPGFGQVDGMRQALPRHIPQIP